LGGDIFKQTKTAKKNDENEVAPPGELKEKQLWRPLVNVPNSRRPLGNENDN